MFITANTINQVFELSRKEFIFEEVLKKFFSRKCERDEFRQELWLSILQMEPKKICDLWNRHEFKYFYIAIITNWVKSTSSTWHKKFRTNKEMLLDYTPEIIDETALAYEDLLEKKVNDSKKVLQVQAALDHYEKIDPQFKFESEVFKLYYFQNLSIRKIQTRLHNIDTGTIFKAIHYATTLIKFHIKKNSTPDK